MVAILPNKLKDLEKKYEFNIQSVCRDLREQGMLFHDKDSRLTKKITGLDRCYVIALPSAADEDPQFPAGRADWMSKPMNERVETFLETHKQAGRRGNGEEEEKNMIKSSSSLSTPPVGPAPQPSPVTTPVKYDWGSEPDHEQPSMEELQRLFPE